MKDPTNPFPFEFHLTDDPLVYVHLRLRQSTLQWFADRYGDVWASEVAAALDSYVAEKKNSIRRRQGHHESP